MTIVDRSNSGTAASRPTPSFGKRGKNRSGRVGEDVRAKGKRSEEQAASNSAQADLRQLAQDEDLFNEYMASLMGKPRPEWTAADRAKVAKLRREVLSGKIAPRTVVAGRGGTRLPKGALGAYVPGGRGTIVMASGQSPGSARETAREEVSEAVAHRAEILGLEVADGDAGDRGRLAMGGRRVTRGRHPDLYRSTSDDSVRVVVGGRSVRAEARVSTAPSHSTDTYRLLSFDGARGSRPDDEVLGEEEFVGGLHSFGVNKKQAKRILMIYGTYTPPKPGSDGQGEWTIDADQMDRAFGSNGLVSHTDGSGTVMMPRFENVTAADWANGVINFTAAQIRISPADVERAGIGERDLDEATDHLFGDWKPVREKDSVKLTRLFGSPKPGRSPFSMSRAELTSLFGTGAISVKKGSDAEGKDFVPISVNHAARPLLRTPQQTTDFMMKYDGAGSTVGDGMLDAEEIEIASQHYYGDSRIGLDTHDAIGLTRLYGSRGKVSAAGIRRAASEQVLTTGERGDQLDLDFTNVEPHRAAEAIFQRAADAAGIPRKDLEWISPKQLQEAASWAFPGELSAADAKSLCERYGTLSQSGGGYRMDWNSLEYAFIDENLLVDGYGGLGANSGGEVLGHPKRVHSPEFETKDYSPQNLDSPGTGRFGRGYYQGRLRVTSRMEPFASVSSRALGAGYNVNTYVPREALDPPHGEVGIYNPPQFHRWDTFRNVIGRIDYRSMSRRELDDEHVAWSIGGTKKTVRKGSKLDQYLTDYYRFSDPRSTQHLRGRANLERSYAYKDKKTGDTIEIWSPRMHQFRTDAKGNKVPIESEAVIVRRDKNGTATIIRSPRVFVAASKDTGRPVLGVGFENTEPDREDTSVYFMPIDVEKLPSNAKRSIANLTHRARETGSYDDLGVVDFNADDTGLQDTEDGGIPLEYSGAPLGRRGNPGGYSLTAPGQKRLRRQIDFLTRGAQNNAAAAATSHPENRAAAKRTEEDGVVMHIDVAIALGIASREDKQSSDQFIQVERSPEVRRRLAAAEIDPQTGEPITGLGEKNKEAIQDPDHAGIFVVRGHHSEIQDNGWDWHFRGPGSQDRARLQVRFKFNTFVVPGFTGTSTLTVRGDGARSRITYYQKAKSVSVFSVRAGIDHRLGKLPLGGPVARGYGFIEGNIGMTWEAGGGADSQGSRGGSWSLATTNDKPTTQGRTGIGFIGNIEARLRVYSSIDTGWARLIPVFRGAPDKFLFGGEVKYAVNFARMVAGETVYPDQTVTIGPIGIGVKKQDRQGFYAEAAWNFLVSGLLGGAAQWLARQAGAGPARRAGTGLGFSLASGFASTAMQPTARESLYGFFTRIFARGQNAQGPDGEGGLELAELGAGAAGGGAAAGEAGAGAAEPTELPALPDEAILTGGRIGARYYVLDTDNNRRPDTIVMESNLGTIAVRRDAATGEITEIPITDPSLRGARTVDSFGVTAHVGQIGLGPQVKPTMSRLTFYKPVEFGYSYRSQAQGARDQGDDEELRRR